MLRERGFSLIELLVVLVIVALLSALAAPAVAKWMANSRIRAVAESLQNDLRLAQAEAIKRNRQVAIVLTSTPSNKGTASITPAISAIDWDIRVLPLANSDETASTYLTSFEQIASSDTKITGDKALLCFNSLGNIAASSASLAYAGKSDCAALTGATPFYFKVTNGTGDRPLWVQVYWGGRVRLCDPSRILPGKPDGCCTTVNCA